MGNIGSAALQSGGFMGESGGLNSINSLDQQTTIVQNPENEPPNYNGNAPQSFTPLTAPQFYYNQQVGPYKYLNKFNSKNTTSSSSSNLFEYLLIGGAIILVVVIIKKNENNQ